MYYNKIGENIKAYRTAHNLTQAAFGERLGLTSATISAYENGSRMPSYDILVRIANIMGVSLDALFGRQGYGNSIVIQLNEAPGTVTVDITNLTSEQRRIIRRTVAIFEAYNKAQSSAESENE